MFVHDSRYLKFKALQAWWPQNVAAVQPLLKQAPVVMLWQCPETLVPEFRRWTFFTRPFHTPLIDLTRSEAELQKRLEPKSCRYEIRKAQKLGCTILCNQELESGLRLLNDSIRRLQYRSELSDQQWRGLQADHDIFLIQWQGTPVVVHVLLRHPPNRTRLVLSGSEDRHQERFRGIVGPANRLLHWHEFLHYQAAGYRFYDFGGCDVDPKAPEYPITAFKLSFGAEPVSEPMLYLAGNPGLRLALRGLAATRNTLRQIPWPETWLHAVRSHPRLSTWIR
jgi:hypothetical protein